jgi:hypothetical protein
MDERAITIILRLVHILAGIFWVGSAFLMAGFLVPTLRVTGPEGGRFIQTMMQRQLTVLSGGIMYVRMALATHGTWAGTRQGIAFGVGGVAALLGGFTGSMISGAAGRRMGELGQQLRGAAPSAEQRAELERLQARVGLGSRVTAAFLAVAAGSMAIARYL